MRDGKRAVKLSAKEDELTGGNDASVLDALAPAQADVGNSDKATEFQKKVLTNNAFE